MSTNPFGEAPSNPVVLADTRRSRVAAAGAPPYATHGDSPVTPRPMISLNVLRNPLTLPASGDAVPPVAPPAVPPLKPPDGVPGWGATSSTTAAMRLPGMPWRRPQTFNSWRGVLETGSSASWGRIPTLPACSRR